MTEKQNDSKQDNLAQMQLIEQNLQNILMQKQNFQTQLTEVDSALDQIKEAGKVYKIVGNLIFSSEKDKTVKDLKEKKEMLDMRLKAINNQESKLREKSQELQKDVLSGMK